MIRVRSVQLQNATIAIKAERILMIYNAQAGSLVNGGPELPVDIQLEMPVGSTESISEILKRVFFSGAELDARACSADEKSAFQSMVSRANLRAGKKAGADTDAGQREVHSYCFPTGDKSFTVAKGILPPKPLRTPDPEYEMSARRDGVQGTSLMVLAIGTDGLPVDALLVKGTDPRLNYKAVCALREWTFKPALRDGVPVPVIVFVEINFALR